MGFVFNFIIIEIICFLNNEFMNFYILTVLTALQFDAYYQHFHI